ncbi:MAG: hydroxymethylpyrimidine pyrophosphatase-like HAD family hydrolase [Bermanella sp.]|jgi:hydroxymethylpyrimidine pyrophosphatase-like HAD family hydrolase
MEMLIKKTSRLFVFTDLDDTLFKSSNKIDCDQSIAATVDSHGDSYAYSSIQQQKLLEIMAISGGIFIPVTGRRTSSFLNCQLPVIANSPYAIVSHGAIILDKNRLLLEEWNDFLKLQFDLSQWKEKLIKTYNYLNAYFAPIDSGIRVRLIVDQGITTYICIKISKNSYSKNKSIGVNRLINNVLQKDMLLHGNGRNFAILPPYAQKKIAVNFLKEKMMINQNDTVFGIGDSHSDLPFMRDSNFLIVPGDAQILNEGKEQ